MSRPSSLSDSQKRAIYNSYTEGERQADLAETYGVSKSTISRIVNEQREMGAMASRGKVVAGDRANGRLMSTTDPHRFEGTCVVGGRRKSRAFTAENARKATEMWEGWCERQRDEDAFMDMVERRGAEPVEQLVEVTYDSMRIVTPGTGGDDSQEVPRVDENAIRLALAPRESVYVIWVRGAAPRLYGAYWRLEDALGEVDRLNEVAAFLGSDDAFEVEEVAWRHVGA